MFDLKKKPTLHDYVTSYGAKARRVWLTRIEVSVAITVRLVTVLYASEDMYGSREQISCLEVEDKIEVTRSSSHDASSRSSTRPRRNLKKLISPLGPSAFGLRMHSSLVTIARARFIRFQGNLWPNSIAWFNALISLPRCPVAMLKAAGEWWEKFISARVNPFRVGGVSDFAFWRISRHRRILGGSLLENSVSDLIDLQIRQIEGFRRRVAGRPATELDSWHNSQV